MSAVTIHNYQETDSLAKEHARFSIAHQIVQADLFLAVTIKNGVITISKPGFHPSSVVLSDAMLASDEFKEIVFDSLNELSILKRSTPSPSPANT